MSKHWTKLTRNDFDRNRYFGTYYTQYKGECAGGEDRNFTYGHVNRFTDEEHGGYNYEAKVYIKIQGCWSRSRWFNTLKEARTWVEYLYKHNDLREDDRPHDDSIDLNTQPDVIEEYLKENKHGRNK